MKTKITVADVQRIGGCQSGLERAIALGARVGISADAEVDFDVVLQTCRDHNDDFLEAYFLKNKAALLEYSDAQFQCYLVGGNEFSDLDSARAYAHSLREQRKSEHLALTSVAFSESVGEDKTWRAIDLDTFELPENVNEYHFHVFNHVTGLHEEAATLEEAKNKRAELIDSHLELDNLARQITMRLVYAEDGTTTKLEVVE